MCANRSIGTRPEVEFRKELWRRGARGYRTNVRRLPGSPDIAFIGRRLAIFVNGCYWHRCPKCQKDKYLKTNAAYWAAKLSENVERDKRNIQSLQEQGFQVLVFWECELKSNLAEMADQVTHCLTKLSTS